MNSRLQNDPTNCRCVRVPPALVNDSIAADPELSPYLSCLVELISLVSSSHVALINLQIASVMS